MRQQPRKLLVNARVAISLSEITLEFSHASGPGGQHVNKVSTQVTACFAVARSQAMTAWEKQRIIRALANRINRDGVLRVSASGSRSQARNREAALTRMRELLAGVLRVPRRRRPTRPTAASRERRLASKRRRAEKKQARRKAGWP